MAIQFFSVLNDEANVRIKCCRLHFRELQGQSSIELECNLSEKMSFVRYLRRNFICFGDVCAITLEEVVSNTQQ